MEKDYKTTTAGGVRDREHRLTNATEWKEVINIDMMFNTFLVVLNIISPEAGVGEIQKLRCTRVQSPEEHCTQRKLTEHTEHSSNRRGQTTMLH